MESPFQSIIAQEISPTPSEKAAIRDFAQDTDAEIASREFAIDRLRCEVAELRRRSEEHKAIIAPIRRVPPEVMAEIFLQLAAIEAEFGRYSCPSPLSQLQGDTYEKRYRVASYRVFVAEVVELDLPQLQERKVKTIDLCKGLLKTVLFYANRWRCVDLENLPGHSYDVLDGLLPASLPLLETLSFSRDERRDNTECIPWAGLCIAPKLRHLYFDSICDARILNEGISSTFPWSHLTQLEVGDCSAYDCLQVLSQASAAVTCRFVVEQPSFLGHPLVSHSGLRRLEIEAHGDLHLLWGCLTCPLLSTLAVEANRPGFYFHDFPSFMTRSTATLENFTLRGCTINGDEFLACLAGMPHLRQLDVTELGNTPQFTDEVWEALAWAPNSPAPLIANLKSLDLQGGKCFSHGSLFRMLKSRVRTPDSPVGFVPKLKSVDISFWRNLSKSALRRINGLSRFGLGIYVEGKDDDEEEDDGSEASDIENDKLDGSGPEGEDAQDESPHPGAEGNRPRKALFTLLTLDY
ncbi:F-box domain-containing protein [Mycena venus]|uniref:F-box domain-containing protein n=1 Tax=Mycena venus TaxID=2733690 RepID=A0A8H6Y8B5_9AGAR|nr:F-box domain-containing protein [Mycena venus]